VEAAWAETTWIQPLPDVSTPEEIMLDRSGTRLAMVAALQTLSARERAAVILHDAVKLSSAEVATAIDSTPAAVNSALQRARARWAAAQPCEDEIVEPTDPAARAALERYVEAFHNADIPMLTGLLRHDVSIEMPPIPTWFKGREDVAGFLASRCLRPGQWRLLITGRGERAAGRCRLLPRRRGRTACAQRHGPHRHHRGHLAHRRVPRPLVVPVVRVAAGG
jgi:RNA polymerase sigma-70 factor (ECF subfamily)